MEVSFYHHRGFMAGQNSTFNCVRTLNKRYHYYSLSALEEALGRKIDRLPVSIRIMLESLLRNAKGGAVKNEDIVRLASWDPHKPHQGDIPFIVSRVILQDFTGVPLVVDLAAMRDAMAKNGYSADSINPQVPVDLIIDHSVQVDHSGTTEAFEYNLELEFKRNLERYSFLKWGQQAFKMFQVFAPGIGIVHQVNLEYLAQVVVEQKVDDGILLYLDTLVGTDSHTTMINGLGVLGWGVGGIEAEAAMLGEPVYLQMPEVIGVHLSGKLPEGITATDLTLRITEILRKEKVVGKFVEFFGEGTAGLSIADRATIANMAPEYGATVGFFPADDQTLDYLRLTGRSEEHVQKVKEYLTAQKLFGIPRKNEIDYTKILEVDLHTIAPCVAGPKRPQDRIDLKDLKNKFIDILKADVKEGGYGRSAEQLKEKICVKDKQSFSLTSPHVTGGVPELGSSSRPSSWSESEMVTNRPITEAISDPGYMRASSEEVCDAVLQQGSIVIAAITSCTNTSNPNVMVAAGLLAKKAVEKGLRVSSKIKTSLAPGSRVVTDYLEKTGLQKYLNQLGFQLVAYGCTTCIGNSGPLEECIENAIKDHDLVVASVLSGNRNFEARIHGAVKANFLMSPPLVVAFALAGRVDIDMTKEPIGFDKDGKPVFLRDVWPSSKEIQEAILEGVKPEMFRKNYAPGAHKSPIWNDISTSAGSLYAWDRDSTYIQNPPYFEDFQLKHPLQPILKDMYPLAIFGDSVTTDHISPAGAFKQSTPAGQYLSSLGIPENEFNSYGSRRGNHHVMMRGTFANIRLKNKMADGKEGGYTKLMPEGSLMTIFDACQIYAQRKTPLIIFAGKDYGMGSSRDWAAKGTALLGVKVVVAGSFERIHRNNLIGMGVLPLQFKEGETAESLKLNGTETFTLLGDISTLQPFQEITLEIDRQGVKAQVKLVARVETQNEIEYYKHGGIMPYILRQKLSKNT